MRRTTALLALGATIALTPVVAWWAIGDISEALAHPDHLFRPPDLSSAQERAIGGTATASGLAAAAVVVIGMRRRLLRPNELAGAVPLLVAGLFAAFSYRVMTAGVGGANIGGGILLLFGPPLLLGLVAWGVALWRLWRR